MCLLCWYGTVERNYVRRFGKGLPKYEEELEAEISKILSGLQISHRRQVKVSSGVIDILTRESIIEVKLHLTRENMRKGLVQLFSYKQDIKPAVRDLILIGYDTDATYKHLALLNRMGISVVVWRGGFDPSSPDPAYYETRTRAKMNAKPHYYAPQLPFDESIADTDTSRNPNIVDHIPLGRRLRPKRDLISLLDEAMFPSAMSGLYFMEMDILRAYVGNRAFIPPEPSDEPDLQDLLMLLTCETQGREFTPPDIPE